MKNPWLPQAIINKTGWCDQVPNLTGRFIQNMIACKVLVPEISEARNPQEYEDISDRLERMNPNRQNKFFGKIAVLFALMSPGFVMDVEERCCSGLLGSPLNQFYRRGFVKSMQEEAGLGHTASFSPTMHKIQMQDIFLLWKGVATVASVETVLYMFYKSLRPPNLDISQHCLPCPRS